MNFGSYLVDSHNPHPAHAAVIPKSDLSGHNLRTDISDVGPGSYSFKSFIGTGGSSAIIPKGGRKEHVDCYLPGPSDYDTVIPSLSKKGARIPQGRNYDDRNRSQSPGVCLYQVEKSIDYISKKHSAAVIPKAPKRSETEASLPGPGDYNTFKPSLSKKGVGKIPVGDLSLAMGRSKSINPGPCMYLVEKSLDFVSKKPANAVIPKSRRTASNDNEQTLPGPTDYTTFISSLNPKNACRVPIGDLSLNYKQEKLKREEPGPCQYIVEKSLDYLSKKQPKAIIPKSRVKAEKEKIPGPADYNTFIPSISSKGVAKISQAYLAGALDSIKDNGPGPCKYKFELSIDYLKKKPANPVISQAKTRTSSELLGPGPGSFESKPGAFDKKGKGVLFSNIQRFTRQSAEANPGPGDYEDPKNSSFKKIKGAAKFRESLYKKEVRQTPGPGDYDVDKHKEITLKSSKKPLKHLNPIRTSKIT